eukprot:CAMPEP_0118706382 /NCGR_PEP_ID=MMETSP0800-20121206/20523_1 /TAXON_ID=210618 ORGANISM="Striatella unipunctata, Strain CCMP2910" /NCGR_SAMPLE_ID=MMETSP0800 /ASSEMBLY_ACC=CAM_ASM_000638 /LENGTH=275 /DNA_ID=CAMNT_0006608903 /DNA_START=8 /DNA_END=835 /DNA_ORIENTATION=+
MRALVLFCFVRSISAWVPTTRTTTKINLNSRYKRFSSSSNLLHRDDDDDDDQRKSSHVVCFGTTKQEEETQVAVARPDPNILISAKTDGEQKLAVLGVFGGIGVGTLVLFQLLGGLESILPEGWFEFIRLYLWSLPMGIIFTAIGATHFVTPKAYLGIVPPKGTWGGLWQVPAPGAEALGWTYEEYHVYWSGVCEVVGGLWLIAAALGGFSTEIPAFLLGCLVMAVTPANTYMYTHDALMDDPNIPPVPYPTGHYIRGAFQMVLLALFFKISFHS